MFWLSTVIWTVFYFCFPCKPLALYFHRIVAWNKVQLNDTIICILYCFNRFIVLFNQLSSCLQIGRNPFDIIRLEWMFSSFPSRDPPPPIANRIPPRMRAATGSLQMQLHREQGLTSWNKLYRGRSLNNLPGSRATRVCAETFWTIKRATPGWISPGSFFFLSFFSTFVVSPVWRR